MAQTRRLFLAVQLSPAINQAIFETSKELRKHLNMQPKPHPPWKIQWIPLENFHLTLKFFGDIDEAKFPVLIESLGKLSQGLNPIRIHTHGIGAFPNLKRPRVIWAGIQEMGTDLKDLVKKIDHLHDVLGFEIEPREFSLHLTLGRVKEGGSLLEALAPYSEKNWGECVISEMILYESKLSKSGSIYSELKRFNFG